MLAKPFPLLLLPLGLPGCAPSTDANGAAPGDTSGGAATGSEVYTDLEAGDLVVNEIMADYDGSNPVPAASGDWLELVNAKDQDLDLSRLLVATENDDSSVLEAANGLECADWTLAAGARMLIVCGHALEYAGAACSIPSQLDREGDMVHIWLEATDGSDDAQLVSALAWLDLSGAGSYARWPDVTGGWQLASTPSPGAVNE